MNEILSSVFGFTLDSGLVLIVFLFFFLIKNYPKQLFSIYRFLSDITEIFNEYSFYSKDLIMWQSWVLTFMHT